MLHYKDKSYCASKVKKHTCGREFTKKDAENVKRLDMPVCWGYFCEQDGGGNENIRD